jgi:cell division septation protein DedD
MLEAPEAVAFGRRVTLHLNVSAPGIPRRREATTAEPTRRARPRRSDQWLSNEQLLVLAVGAALVTGVLLFPVEPTEYPAPAPPDAVPASAPPDAVAAAAPPEAVAPSAPPDAVVPSAPAARDAAPPAPVSAPVAPVVEERAVAVSEPEAVEPPSPHRFSPPARPGPAFQVGAFRKLENATRLAERLERDFDGVYIHQLGAGPTSLYRVRVSIPGLLAESALARELRARDYAIVRIE